MSNRPKPTGLRILQGNPGRRPLNQNEPEPKAPTKVPSPPRFLGSEAKAEWRRVVKKLLDVGLYTELDRSALAAYCVCWDTWRQANKSLDENGLTVCAPTGHLRKSPYLAIADRALVQMRAFFIEFGMTPAARSRLSVEPPLDEFGRWMFGDR